ncbi:MAG: vitamin K epoxide reductase family protein [Cyclobacteriaceae bacterium]|tara:strand:+ start:7046 stop:8626 length:1581 start_codon:yes stop_codon:yes gene_type:complete
MKKEDNVIAVIKKAVRHYDIKVSEETIQESLQSHPNYPSLKSVCDSLKEWKIDNYAMHLTREELKEADVPFIAHLKEGNIVFVPSLNGNSKVDYFETFLHKKTIDEDEFFKKHSGATILLDPGKEAGEKAYKEKRQNRLLHKAIPYIGLTAILSYLVYLAVLPGVSNYDLSLSFIGMISAKIVGLIFSILIVLKTLKIESSLADVICGFQKKTDCNSLLNSDAAKVFSWLQWGDIGLIYFVSGLLSFVSVSPGDYGFLAALSFASLGFVLYSIYYQWIVAKTWCLLCCGVLIALIAEAFMAATFFLPINLSMNGVLNYLVILLFTGFIVLLFKTYYLNLELLNKEKTSLLRFKRDPMTFSSILQSTERKEIPVPKEVFTIGSKESSMVVTAFLSLHCNPCQRAFNQLKPLFEGKNVTVNLVFSFAEADMNLANTLYNLLTAKDYNAAVDMLDRWYNSNKKDKMDLSNQFDQNGSENSFISIQKTHKELFHSMEIKGTPTIFINGHKFPKMYEYKDLLYFSNESKLN